ncbi:MAG: DOMON domain-containing protein [Cyclobacteriaceae bacterium]
MKTIFLLFATTVLLRMMSSDPKTLRADEFQLEWSHNGEEVRFTLSAPTSGWVAVGFTEGRRIEDTNLIQGCFREGEVFVQDQYATGFGEHPPVEALGVPSRISNIHGKQQDGNTIISFSIHREKLDKLHYDLSEGREINVWLAYSVSDDFDHHSRKRILRSIKL